MLTALCAREEVTLDQLQGHLRQRHLVDARRRIWGELRAIRNDRGRHAIPLTRIAGWFGVWHTAISSALKGDA